MDIFRTRDYIDLNTRRIILYQIKFRAEWNEISIYHLCNNFNLLKYLFFFNGSSIIFIKREKLYGGKKFDEIRFSKEKLIENSPPSRKKKIYIHFLFHPFRKSLRINEIKKYLFPFRKYHPKRIHRGLILRVAVLGLFRQFRLLNAHTHIYIYTRNIGRNVYNNPGKRRTKRFVVFPAVSRFNFISPFNRRPTLFVPLSILLSLVHFRDKLL